MLVGIDRQIEAINYNKKQFYKNKYNWIERLLNKPLDNFRKYCITFVFVPYYINIKGMSEEEAFEHIKLWIDRSSFLEELDFNAEKRIRRDISRVKKFTPFPPEKIKYDYRKFYERLQEEGIIKEDESKFGYGSIKVKVEAKSSNWDKIK